MEYDYKIMRLKNTYFGQYLYVAVNFNLHKVC